MMRRSMGSSANDKSESEDFDEDDAGPSAEGADDVDVDHLMRNLDRLKRRGAKLSDPAWRRLERYREDKETEELLSDFDDYDLDGDLDSELKAASAAEHRLAAAAADDELDDDSDNDEDTDEDEAEDADDEDDDNDDEIAAADDDELDDDDDDEDEDEDEDEGDELARPTAGRKPKR